MNTIKVRDKEFSIFLTEAKIKEQVNLVAEQINKDFAGKKPLFIAVLNGSFIFAADLMRCINIPCEIEFVRVSSYVGTTTTGQVKQLLGLKEDIKGRHVVIVEDIIDSGLTMKELLSILESKGAADVKVASLLVKPDNLQVDLDISYRCFEIPNDFILGYGLDYDGEGRNLKDIYKVVD
jgi:hypoxanthine phosphoribosyltransferase